MELQMGTVDRIEGNVSLGQDVMHQATAVPQILVGLALLLQFLR